MTEVPVHAVIVSPAAGACVRPGPHVIAGAAWGGSGGVARVEVKVDDGAWADAVLAPGGSRYGRRLWTFAAVIPDAGAAVSVRATDAAGARQPARPRWNRGGYANNSVHTVVVDAAAPRRDPAAARRGAAA
jgi:hypothetical protein